jgi:hypothetical protein
MRSRRSPSQWLARRRVIGRRASASPPASFASCAEGPRLAEVARDRSETSASRASAAPSGGGAFAAHGWLAEPSCFGERDRVAGMLWSLKRR